MKKGRSDFGKTFIAILHVIAAICLAFSLCYMAYAVERAGGDLFTLLKKTEGTEGVLGTGDGENGESTGSESGAQGGEETLPAATGEPEKLPASSDDKEFREIFYSQIEEAIEYTWYAHAFEDWAGHFDPNKTVLYGSGQDGNGVGYSIQDFIYFVDRYGIYNTGQLGQQDDFSDSYWNDLIGVSWCAFDLTFPLEPTTGSPVAYENRLVGMASIFQEKMERYEELKEKFTESENGLVFEIGFYPSSGSDIYVVKNRQEILDYTKLDTYFILTMPESGVDTNLADFDRYDLPEITEAANNYHIGDRAYTITAGWANTSAALKEAEKEPAAAGNAEGETGTKEKNGTEGETGTGPETKIDPGAGSKAEGNLILSSSNPAYAGQQDQEPSPQELQFYRNSFLACGIIFAVSLLVGVITLVLLAFSAGEVIYNGERRIRLSAIDSCYIELLALAVLCLAWFWNWLSAANASEAVPFVSQAVVWIGYYFILLIAAFSLIRRNKAGRLMDHSLIMAVAKRIQNAGKKFSENEKPVTKTIISSAVWIAANIVLIVCIWRLAESYRNSGELGYLAVMVILGAILAGIYVYAFINNLSKAMQRQKIIDGVQSISKGELDTKIPAGQMTGDERVIADSINNIGNGLVEAVGTATKSERMKADLITNVSHDIKTPLTSIINYVGLLKRENIQNEKAQGYIGILEQKSQRLKNLIEDLVEASKASSGNVTLDLERIDFIQLVKQIDGEFRERFDAAGLRIVATIPEVKIFIHADGRRVWRILENLYQNALKYAMKNTRVYIAVVPFQDKVGFVMKNVSASPLNFEAQDLTERFIRGDVARTTEGSGLGLSIAKSLTELHGGEFQVYLDGDLFKVSASFKTVK